MKIAFIDDQEVVCNAYRNVLYKAGAVTIQDTFDSFLMPETFFQRYTNIQVTSTGISRIIEMPEQIEITCDAIICDHDLGSGKIDGHSLLRLLQQSGYKGVCILLTGDKSEEMKEKMKSTPNVHYAYKGAKSIERNPYIVIGEILKNIRRQSNN